MTTSTTASLDPAIDVLAQCLAQTCENYQQLLNQPDSYCLCKEAGRSLRYLSKRYAQVVQTVLAYQTGPDDDDENWEDQEEDFSE